MAQNKELMDYTALLDRVKKLPGSQVYLNSAPVINVSGENLTVWNVLTASILGNLNALVIGERGEGKTQVLNELANVYFGGRYTYIRMRDHIKTKDIYEVYNLEKLFNEKKGRVTDAKELTTAVNNPITIFDEINRAHEKVQNQVFDIYDGYIIFEGPNGPEKIYLGIKIQDGLHYHSTIASANVGGSRYTGISPIDPALLDRSHLILNVDNYGTSTLDNISIINNTKTAKIINATDNKDYTKEIVGIYNQIRDLKLTMDAIVALLYLKKGLDYCTHHENPTKRKLPVLSSIPGICEDCRELGAGCGYIKPISVRTEKATLLLAKALKTVADSKSADKIKQSRVRYQDILSAFTLIGPYSDILDEKWVNEQFLRNQHFALSTVINNIAQEIRGASSVLEKSLNESFTGKLSDATKKQFSGRWGWYGEILVAFNNAASKYGNLKDIKVSELKEAVQEHPILGLLR